jgi:SPP1 family predicted phage head-tail adaptor
MNTCDLHSGLLQHHVTVQRLTLVPDGGGGGQSVWATLYQPWAYITPVGTWEKMSGMQLESPITHSIYIRYYDDINPRDRIVHRGRIFNIRSIIDMEEKKIFLELKCEEGVAV